ncbi:PEP-CTERM sorting domain-containing protein [Microcoleus sp. FACHB-45]|nr:PEP-CTERM sorting domain-containing protein [Microcoleus sp. FACHB-84]MBD2007920.1 PEP-CTERM sorting domain-containing protein [Microcoleus sp. FACHB-45]
MNFQLNLVKSILAVAGVAAVSAVSAAPASAVGFSFSNIVGGDNPGDAYQSNFTFDVLEQGESVLFNISNSGNAAAPSMFISKVLFDDNNFLSNAATNIAANIGTVAFTGGVGDDQLPQGGNGFTTNYAFSSDNGGGNKWGVQAGETLGLKFTGNYANVVSALNTGALKLGLHVQALPNGASDSYISSTSNTEATPEPLTMLAAGAAVGFGAMFKKQRDQAQKAQ